MITDRQSPLAEICENVTRTFLIVGDIMRESLNSLKRLRGRK